MLIIKVKAIFALGLINVARVLIYKISLKPPFSNRYKLPWNQPHAPFFMPVNPELIDVPKKLTMLGKHYVFDLNPVEMNARPPQWFKTPAGELEPEIIARKWWDIPDFTLSIGDIKFLWDLSRMNWVLIYGKHVANGDANALLLLNQWLEDWCIKNRDYCGPNWKCGQEASIRIINLACASIIMKQLEHPTSGTIDFVRMHLQRIKKTLGYAIGQNNNHGTSEAAGLYVGGAWLWVAGCEDGIKYMRIGKRMLENRLHVLVDESGCFSQYSTNYHRMVLETISSVELVRRELDLRPLSESYYENCEIVMDWLFSMVDSTSGDAPNCGANDGTHLFQAIVGKYRDFRPTIQLAAVLFGEALAYTENTGENVLLDWFGLDIPKKVLEPKKILYHKNGAFIVIENNDLKMIFRRPIYRFRPSQSDALHIDVWRYGQNILCDDGTFGYNTGAGASSFGATASHNTVEFDGRDQMPKINRFLYGNWLREIWSKPLEDLDENIQLASGYKDSYGAEHRRQVQLGGNILKVKDEISGFNKQAILRWRFGNSSNLQIQQINDYQIKLQCASFTLLIDADMPIERAEIVNGFISKQYAQKSPISVLEIEVHKSGDFNTTFEFT